MARNYTATLNNYTEEDYEDLINHKHIGYIIIGREIGEKGTKHLQMYFQLKEKKRLPWVKKHINNKMHIEQSRGTPDDNVKYCSKDNDFKERGIITKQGSNTIQIYEQIQECDNWGDVLKIEGIDRRMPYAREVFASKKIKKQPEIKPRKWQQKILDILKEEPDDRTIVWIYDETGGRGKTYLCKYLMSNHDAFYCSPSKGTDILHAYNNQRIILYDIPRCVDDQYINWGTIEKLKDGILFSGKFNSTTKYRTHNAHIIIFSNNEPPEGKFSRDRIKQYVI